MVADAGRCHQFAEFFLLRLGSTVGTDEFPGRAKRCLGTIAADLRILFEGLLPVILLVIEGRAVEIVKTLDFRNVAVHKFLAESLQHGVIRLCRRLELAQFLRELAQLRVIGGKTLRQLESLEYGQRSRFCGLAALFFLRIRALGHFRGGVGCLIFCLRLNLRWLCPEEARGLLRGDYRGDLLGLRGWNWGLRRLKGGNSGRRRLDRGGRRGRNGNGWRRNCGRGRCGDWRRGCLCGRNRRGGRSVCHLGPSLGPPLLRGL